MPTLSSNTSIPLDPSEDSFKYWAFISYSHRDRKWGQWLHKKLENYRVPRHLVNSKKEHGSLPNRLTPIFRDRDELPTSPDLGRAIIEALTRSRTLLVVCSPHSARSHWVNEEIRIFKRLERSDHVLCLIVDGEPNASDKPGLEECFPEELRYEFDANGKLSASRTEPLAADVRPHRDGKTDATLKIIAGVLGVGFDELKQRELRRQHGRYFRITAFALAVMFVTVALAVMAMIARDEAEKHKIMAEANAAEAESARTQAELNERLANEKAEALRTALYFSHITQAEAETKRNHVSNAKELLNACPVELRAWEWYRLGHLLDRSHATLRFDNQFPEIARFSNDGGYAAIATALDIELYDTELKNKFLTLKHHSSINSFDISPDGKRLVSGIRDTTIRVWDTVSGVELMVLEGHADRVTNVVIHPDGKRMASGSSDRTIRLWDLETGNQLAVFRGHTGQVISIGFSPDGKRLVSAGLSGAIKLWDIRTGSEVVTIGENSSASYSVRFSPDAKRILSTGSLTKQWDAANGEKLLAIKLSGHKAAYSPDGRVIAVACYDNTIRLVDSMTGDELALFRGHEDRVSSVEFSPDGKRLISTSGDQTVRLWDIESAVETVSLENGNKPVTSIAFSPDGRLVATCGQQLKLWDAQTTQEVFTLDSKGLPRRFIAVAFSPDGKHIAGGTYKALVLWDVQTGDETLAIMKHEGWIRSVSFSPNSKRIASASSDKTIKIWDTETDKEMTLKGHNMSIGTVTYSSDGKYILSGGYDGQVKMWDADTGATMFTVRGHAPTVFSPGGRSFVVPSDNVSFKTRDAASGTEKVSFRGHTGDVECIAFSPDGRRLASGGRDNTIMIWDSESGKEVMTLQGHRDGVSSIAFSPDGRQIISGSLDGEVKLWNTAEPDRSGADE